MDEKITAFREQVLQWRGARKKGARPYTAEMKATALQLAKALQSSGVSMEVAAKRLGIPPATIYVWRSESAPKKMVPVMVARAVPAAPSMTMRLISPHGYRAEGLSVGVAVAMLRELG